MTCGIEDSRSVVNAGEKMCCASLPETGSVLSDTDIIAARENGLIRIEPFNPENLTNVAYDISISGESVFYETGTQPIDAGNRDSVRASWRLATNLEIIIIPPGQSIIAHSHEFIGSFSHAPITTELRARSSLASRLGVSVSASGGWGDVGFRSRWAMLLTNHRRHTVRIQPGMRVAQIIFHRVSSLPSRSYASKGSYAGVEDSTSGRDSFEDLRARWSAESLL